MSHGGPTPTCTLSPRTHLEARGAAGAYAVGFGRRAAGSTSATKLDSDRPINRQHRLVCQGLRRRLVIRDVGRVLVGRAGGRYVRGRVVPIQLTSSAMSAPVALAGWLAPCPAPLTSSRASSPEMEGSRASGGGASVRAPALSSARGAPGSDASARPAGSRRLPCASSSARSKPPAALGAGPA